MCALGVLLTTWPPDSVPLLFMKLPLPLYVAPTLCMPVVSVFVVMVAVVTPSVVLTFTGAPGLPSIQNTTGPVGVPPPGPTTPIVAVKVTGCPNSDGLAEELTAVVVPAWLTVSIVIPVLLLLFGSRSEERRVGEEGRSRW